MEFSIHPSCHSSRTVNRHALPASHVRMLLESPPNVVDFERFARMESREKDTVEQENQYPFNTLTGEFK